jgi:hypothetical protein
MIVMLVHFELILVYKYDIRLGSVGRSGVVENSLEKDDLF